MLSITWALWVCIQCSYILEKKAKMHYSMHLFPEPTARSAVPGVSPGRGLLIPHGYLHPGKCEHSEVQSSSMIAGASLWLIGGPHWSQIYGGPPGVERAKIQKNIWNNDYTTRRKVFSTFRKRNDKIWLKYGTWWSTWQVCFDRLYLFNLYFCKKVSDCKKTLLLFSQEVWLRILY